MNKFELCGRKLRIGKAIAPPFELGGAKVCALVVQSFYICFVARHRRNKSGHPKTSRSDINLKKLKRKWCFYEKSVFESNTHTPLLNILPYLFFEEKCNSPDFNILKLFCRYEMKCWIVETKFHTLTRLRYCGRIKLEQGVLERFIWLITNRKGFIWKW